MAFTGINSTVKVGKEELVILHWIIFSMCVRNLLWVTVKEINLKRSIIS